jgi:hypothetical protein
VLHVGQDTMGYGGGGGSYGYRSKWSPVSSSVHFN